MKHYAVLAFENKMRELDIEKEKLINDKNWFALNGFTKNQRQHNKAILGSEASLFPSNYKNHN